MAARHHARMDQHDHAPGKPTRQKRPRDPHPAALAYGVDEAGRVLGISRRTVYELIAQQRLKSLKLAGRRLVTRASCEALLAEAGE